MKSINARVQIRNEQKALMHSITRDSQSHMQQSSSNSCAFDLVHHISGANSHPRRPTSIYRERASRTYYGARLPYLRGKVISSFQARVAKTRSAQNTGKYRRPQLPRGHNTKSVVVAVVFVAVAQSSPGFTVMLMCI